MQSISAVKEKIVLLFSCRKLPVKAKELDIETTKGGFLLENKLDEVEQLKKKQPNTKVDFIGDGINDAPVLAASRFNSMGLLPLGKLQIFHEFTPLMVVFLL